MAVSFNNNTTPKETKKPNKPSQNQERKPTLKYLWNRHILKYLHVSDINACIYIITYNKVLPFGLKPNQTMVLNVDGAETECCRNDLRFGLPEAFSIPCSVTDSVYQ